MERAMVLSGKSRNTMERAIYFHEQSCMLNEKSPDFEWKEA